MLRAPSEARNIESSASTPQSSSHSAKLLPRRSACLVGIRDGGASTGHRRIDRDRDVTELSQCMRPFVRQVDFLGLAERAREVVDHDPECLELQIPLLGIRFA